MDLKAIQEYALVLSKQNGWDKEPLDTRLDYLMSEITEIEVEIENYENSKTVEDRTEVKTKLGHEIFDAIWNLAELANRFDIDLSTSAEQKVSINSNREFSKIPHKEVV